VSVNIEKKSKATSICLEGVLQKVANDLHFMHSAFSPFRIIISEEMSVHISALKVGTVVANHHAVWICHWQNPKFELVPHFVGQSVCANQIIDEAVQNETTMSLSGVLTRYYYYYGSFLRSFFNYIPYFQQRNIKSSNTHAQIFKCDEVVF